MRKAQKLSPEQVRRAEGLLLPIPSRPQEGEAWAVQRHHCQPPSCVGFAGARAGTWATAFAHGAGPPRFPPVPPTVANL